MQDQQIAELTAAGQRTLNAIIAGKCWKNLNTRNIICGNFPFAGFHAQGLILKEKRSVILPI